MKKICISLCITLVLSCTACSEELDVDKSTSESETPLESISLIQEIETFTTPQETAIHFVSSDWYRLDDITEKAINHYLYNEGADYYIQFEYLPEKDYRNNIKNRLSSSEPCDVFFTDFLPKDYFLDNDSQLPLSTYLHSETGKELKDALPDHIWEALERDGEIYGVTGLFIASTSPSYMVNKKYMDKYDITVEDLQVDAYQLQSILEMIKDKENITPFVMPSEHLRSEYNSISTANCLYVNRFTGEVTYYFDAEESSKRFRTFNQYAKEGLLTPNLPVDKKTDDVFIIYQGNYSPEYEFYYDLYVDEGDEIAKNNQDYILIPIYDEVYSDHKIGSATCIHRETKHQEESLDFLHRLYTDPALTDLFHIGVKDVHYTINEEGKVCPINDEDPQQYKDYRYRSVGMLHGNQYISTPMYNEFSNKKDIRIDLESKAIQSDLIQMEFIYDDKIISAIEEKNLTVLKEHVEPELYDLYLMLINNESFDLVGIELIFTDLKTILDKENPASYDDIINKMRTMLDESGADALIKEAERIIEEYRLRIGG